MRFRLIEEKEDKAIYNTRFYDTKKYNGQTVTCINFNEEDNRVQIKFDDGTKIGAFPAELTFLDDNGQPLKKDD